MDAYRPLMLAALFEAYRSREADSALRREGAVGFKLAVAAPESYAVKSDSPFVTGLLTADGRRHVRLMLRCPHRWC